MSENLRSITAGLTLVGILCGMFFVKYHFFPDNPLAIPVDSLTLSLNTVHWTKLQFELNENVQNFVRYGNALDTLSYRITAVRDSIQERFFYQLAKEAGEKYDVNWRVLYGIWMRESRMNPNVKGDGRKDSMGVIIPGSHRAFGLGQVHLATARDHYDPNITKERLMDPVENGYASAATLRDYIKLMNGDERYGIAAFNLGPGTVQAFYNKRQAPPNYWGYVSEVYKYALTVN